MKFFRILIHPRETMRSILDQPRDRMVVPLVVMAICSSVLRNAHFDGVKTILTGAPFPLWVFIVAPICVIAAGVGLFFVFAWIATMIGRFFEGKGEYRGVVRAMAWSFVPIIVALAYRVPVAIFVPSPAQERLRLGPHTVVTIAPRSIGAGCSMALLSGLLELAILSWYLYVASNTVAEAHGFSGWRGLGTVLATWITPIVILAAAVLASR